MSTPVATPATIALHVTREEAEMIVEGLHMLRNCRRFSAKEPGDDVRTLHAALYDALERIEGELAPLLGRRGASAAAAD